MRRLMSGVGGTPGRQEPEDKFPFLLPTLFRFIEKKNVVLSKNHVMKKAHVRRIF